MNNSELERLVNRIDGAIASLSEVFSRISEDAIEFGGNLHDKYRHKGKNDIALEIKDLYNKLLDCLEKANQLVILHKKLELAYIIRYEKNP